MHFFKALVLGSLPLLVAAKKPAVDNFQRFNAKQQASTPLKLDDAAYASLTSAPRDYSVAILLTALDTRFGCVLCRDFQPEWELLSKSWVKGDKKSASRLVYGTLDFTDGKATFQSVSATYNRVLISDFAIARSTDSTSAITFPAHHRTSCSEGCRTPEVRLHERVSELVASTKSHLLNIVLGLNLPNRRMLGSQDILQVDPIRL